MDKIPFENVKPSIMKTTLPWNAIYVRRNCEKKVCKLLEKKKIFCYFPECIVSTEINNNSRIVYTALFPSTIFVQGSPDKIHSITQLPDVINLVYYRRFPASIPALEIDALQNFLNRHETVQLKKKSVNIAERDSKQEDFANQYFTNNHHGLNLPSLGYTLLAETKLSKNTYRILEREDSASKKVRNTFFIHWGAKSTGISLNN